MRAEPNETFCGILGFLRENLVRRKMSQKEEISFSDKAETLIVDNAEHVFHDEEIYSILALTKWVSCVLILLTNVPLLVFIMKQASKSFLDWLIVIDCLLCLSNIESILLDGIRGIFRIFLTVKVTPLKSKCKYFDLKTVRLTGLVDFIYSLKDPVS